MPTSDPKLTISRTNYTSWVSLDLPLDPYISNLDLLTGRAGRGLRGADWISPLFWPESNKLFLTKFQSSCDKASWQLIRDTHELVEIVLGASEDENAVSVDTTIAKLKALEGVIKSLPKGEQKDNCQASSRQVHRYECCRLTANLMTRAISQGMTWSEAASGTTYAKDIIFSLSNSDTEGLWGDHVGLLYWVSLISYAVLCKTEYRLFGAGIIHRLISEVTFGDQDPRIGIHSLKRLGGFREKCSSGELRYCRTS
jgi:hypothetical protein